MRKSVVALCAPAPNRWQQQRLKEARYLIGKKRIKPPEGC